MQEINICRNLAVLDVLDALPFYVLLVDADHNILEANKAVHSQLGMNREDIIGRYCPQVIHGRDQYIHGCPLEEAVKKNAAVETELFDEKSGRWVASAVYPIETPAANGKKIYVHMVTDITDRVEAQEQLRDSHERLRRLTAYLESVREEEKRKISRDLHDETSQVLASLYAHLEAAIGTLPEGSKQTEVLLRKAQTLSTTILDEIRKLIYELRPAVLDKLGLVAAIDSLVESYLRFAGLKVRFKVSGRQRRLPPAVEIVLFRVVQESFNNIVKHSKAKKVEMNIHFNRSSTNIDIRDDGIGFNIKEVTGPKNKEAGLGLLGMTERIQSLNGSLTISSNPGEGTEVKIEIPVKKGGSNG